MRAYFLAAIFVSLAAIVQAAEKTPPVETVHPAEKTVPAGIVSTKTVWTAFAWGVKGWHESVVAKTVSEDYEGGGRLSSSVLALGSGLILERAKFQYDSDGRLLNQTISDAAKKVLRTTVYIYAPHAVSLITSRGDGTLIEDEERSLNSRGFATKADFFDSTKTLLRSTQFRYDSNGLVIEEYTSGPDGSPIYDLIHVYGSFDAIGNWTVRSDYEAYSSIWKSPRYVLRRTLLYKETPR